METPPRQTVIMSTTTAPAASSATGTNGQSRLTNPAAGNGMQVAYEARADQWGGLGLFAAEDITAGTLIWDFAKANIKEYSNDESKAMCLALKRDNMDALMEFHTATYFRTAFNESFILVDIRRDDGRYFNHTNGPRNVALGSVVNDVLGTKKHEGRHELCSTYAIVDIPAGAEFLDNYNTYGDSPPWYSDMLEEHGVSEGYMLGSAIPKSSAPPTLLPPTPAATSNLYSPRSPQAR